jgi:hypothetical protein
MINVLITYVVENKQIAERGTIRVFTRVSVLGEIKVDNIKAVKGLSPHMGKREHLSIFVNGERLDDYLSKNVDDSFLGLVPAWLNDYDETFLPSKKEKEYVWEQTKLENGTRILPILLCPDDFDFSCTTIVVEVIGQSDTVIWNRFGADMTDFDVDEIELPNI